MNIENLKSAFEKVFGENENTKYMIIEDFFFLK